MLEYIDQMNNTIRLAETPCRIVSLVPSQTQLLHSLGLNEEVVGITKFCIHPDDWFRSKNRIGGTKNVNIDKVRSLNPDLIFANKEENTKEDIEALRMIAPVWLSDIFNLEDSIAMIKSFGEIVNKLDEASLIIQKIESAFRELASFDFKKRSVLYFIWNEPGYTAGKGTFIDDMLKRCDLENVIKENRYPEVPLNINPEVVFLSSEPFPFKEKHIELYQKRYPKAIIKIVDGEMFSWYGSKLIESPKYFKTLLSEI
tara:strand:+ start:6716 stop:7486 length:771 start_codon:yes stop_codon:yes gene_type:complete